MSKATEARARPGLKGLTPWEQALVERTRAQDLARWAELFARNKWAPADPDLRTRSASSSRPRASSRV